MDFIIELVLIALIGVVCLLLPESPFTYVADFSEYSDVMGMLNYFIPFATIVSIMEVWLVSVAAYYVLQAYLRWTKVTQ